MRLLRTKGQNVGVVVGCPSRAGDDVDPAPLEVDGAIGRLEGGGAPGGEHTWMADAREPQAGEGPAGENTDAARRQRRNNPVRNRTVGTRGIGRAAAAWRARAPRWKGLRGPCSTICLAAANVGCRRVDGWCAFGNIVIVGRTVE